MYANCGTIAKSGRELRDSSNAWSEPSGPPAYHEVASSHMEASLPRPIPGPLSTTPYLEKVVAIPATSPKLGSPFLRAYPPALEQFGIPQDVFLDFLDGLNRVAVASPPVQLLGLAGNIVSMVPLHTAQAVGGIVNATATLSTVVMSKSAVAMHMRDANSQIFGPRGLTARVSKLESVAQCTGMPILNAEGSIDKRSPILRPLFNGSEGDSASQDLSVQHQRIAALRQWTSPLVIKDLPVINSPQNAFSKMNTSASERQRRKEEEKMDKDRRKHQEKWSKGSISLEKDLHDKMEKLNREEQKVTAKGGRRMQHELEKLAKERAKAISEHERDLGKLSRSTTKGNKEEEAMRKILFLVVQRNEV